MIISSMSSMTNLYLHKLLKFEPRQKETHVMLLIWGALFSILMKWEPIGSSNRESYLPSPLGVIWPDRTGDFYSTSLYVLSLGEQRQTCQLHLF